MFDKWIKKTKVCKEVQRVADNSTALIQQQIKEMVELKDEIDRMKASGAIPVEEGNSSILFEIDKDLKITTKSRINKDIISTLIDSKYIDSAQSEDEAVIQLVFILLVNEVTEQIMEEVNENAN